ncbi:signal peptide-containing protein [Theileria equi strain WA]|uniref:Signal peptide-containing protein n=1 Tax=Theileria equi strain WA TaxID=1537102 RepID=L0AWG8_THEEQ|nr:signal peptide-containing protein [Theileria equi strain WA]AFZ79598.1 signal peptide-containing protein [Theileria equi strain WA]|eukprot:XP_004829264.1 signal peptide-containing protein [Theileria equi strain WA]
MTALYTFVFACLLGFSACHEAGDVSCSPVTFDFAHVDTSKLFSTYNSYYGVHEKSFFTKERGFIGKVVDGEEGIWEAALDEASPLVSVFYKHGFSVLLVVYVKSEGEVYVIYYKKKANGWILICKEAFEAALDAMKHDDASFEDEVPVQVAGKYIINIMTNLSDSRVNVTRPTEDNPFMVVRPASGFLAPKVMEGTSTIWESKDGEGCEAVYFLTKDKKVVLAQLSIKAEDGSSTLCFEKTDDWAEISHEEYEAKVDEIVEVMKVPSDEDSFLTNSFSLLLAAIFTVALF